MIEFAIGMGPKLFSRQKGETLYSIRAIPMGGFCAMEGEDEESSDRRAFGNAPLYKRVIVMLAGSAMNLALGLLLVGILTSQIQVLAGTTIAGFADTAVSNQQLQEGDEVVRMNGHRVRTWNDMAYEMQRAREGSMEIQVKRDGQTVLLEDVPFNVQNLEGVNFITRDFYLQGVEKTLWGSVKYTVNWSISIVKQVWGSLVDLITGRYGINALSGPVGVTTAIGQASSSGWKDLLYMVSMITINLGVFNLLPLPALDGGRIVFLLIELVRRKPVEAKYEGVIHAVGFMLLIGLMIFVTVNDVIKLV